MLVARNLRGVCYRIGQKVVKLVVTKANPEHAKSILTNTRFPEAPKAVFFSH